MVAAVRVCGKDLAERGMTPSLLVVDDEALNRAMIAAYLEREGFALTMAEDGEQALALLGDGRAFDAVLLDRMMPGIDGIEVLKRLKRDPRFSALPVIMQTAADGHEQVAEGLRLGAHYYLTKPYHRDALLAVVRSALSASEQRQRLAQQIEEYRGVMGLIDDSVFRYRSIDEARALAAALASMCRDPAAAGFGLLELLINAVEHGNLGIRLEDKAELLAAGRWEQEVAARFALPENAAKFVEVRCQRQGEHLRICIRDQGAGFDWRGFLAMDDARVFRPNGRGIALAREVAFETMEYRGPGNQVEVSVAARNHALHCAGHAGHDDAESELELGAALMASILQRHDGLRDPALTWAVLPSHRFSGDAVAAVRTPSGRLLAMLADATGHGLQAAISVLPLLQVFYAMAGRDFPLPELTAEMNRRLRAFAPAGVFLAAVVVAFDPGAGRVEVWNGGMPGGLWLHAGGERGAATLASRHLPLGILDDRRFDGTCAVLDARRGRLVFFSDGLIEAESPGGEPFGAVRLRRHLLDPCPDPGFQHLLDAVRAHLRDAPAHDDISLMMIALD
jgi:CheY-like chemotaxis protein/serine phosphatase RsbU (regulator of sigma subunit)